MPKIETDKVRELHSIALTLRDILKELKRFNRNYELIYSERSGPTIEVERTPIETVEKMW